MHRLGRFDLTIPKEHVGGDLAIEAITFRFIGGVYRVARQDALTSGHRDSNIDLSLAHRACSSPLHFHEADFANWRAIRLFWLRADIDQLEQFLVPQIAANFDLNANVHLVVFAKDRPQSGEGSEVREDQSGTLIFANHHRSNWTSHDRFCSAN